MAFGIGGPWLGCRVRTFCRKSCRNCWRDACGVGFGRWVGRRHRARAARGGWRLNPPPAPLRCRAQWPQPDTAAPPVRRPPRQPGRRLAAGMTGTTVRTPPDRGRSCLAPSSTMRAYRMRRKVDRRPDRARRAPAAAPPGGCPTRRGRRPERPHGDHRCGATEGSARGRSPEPDAVERSRRSRRCGASPPPPDGPRGQGAGLVDVLRGGRWADPGTAPLHGDHGGVRGQRRG